jgi:hypothetical protein
VYSSCILLLNVLEQAPGTTLTPGPKSGVHFNVLAERLPFVSRHALARAALKIGLAALEANPKRLVDEEMVRSPRERKRASRKS